MDPINKKEINSSFIQFLTMFVIAVLFAIICVFWDVKFFDKDYNMLKSSLKEKTIVFDKLKSDFEPINTSLINMANINDESEFVKIKDNLILKLDDLDKSQPDSSDIQKFILTINRVYRQSMYDKITIFRNKDCINKIKKLEQDNTELEKQKRDLEKENTTLTKENIDLSKRNN